MKHNRLNSFTEDAWDSLIGKIYNAALYPETWGDVLIEIGKPINAHAGQLVTMTSNLSGAYENLVVGLDAEVSLTQFYELLERGEHVRADFGSQAAELTTVVDYQHSSERDMKRHRFYQTHAVPLEIPYYGATIVKKSDDDFVVSVMMRSKNAGHFQQDEVDYLNRIGPHLRRSIELAMKLPEQGAIGSAAGIVEQLSCGAVLIDNHMRIAGMNERAQAYFHRDDGLMDDNGVLAIRSPTANRQLIGELNAALSLRSAVHRASSGKILAPRNNGQPSYTLVIAPLGSRGKLFQVRHCAVLIVDPDERIQLSSRELRDRFGLTPAETSIVQALVDGLSTSEIAMSRGCAGRLCVAISSRQWSKPARGAKAN